MSASPPAAGSRRAHVRRTGRVRLAKLDADTLPPQALHALQLQALPATVILSHGKMTHRHVRARAPLFDRRFHSARFGSRLRLRTLLRPLQEGPMPLDEISTIVDQMARQVRFALLASAFQNGHDHSTRQYLRFIYMCVCM